MQIEVLWLYNEKVTEVKPTNEVLTLILLKKKFNFHPLEVVSRYRDPQLQMAENY